MSDDGRHWSDESWKLPDDVHPCVTPHFDCSAGSPPCVSYHCAGFHPGLDGHGFRIQFRPAHTESVCRQVYKVAVEYAKLRLTERGFGRAVRAAFLEDAARLRRLIAEDLRLDRKKAYRKNGHAE